VRGVALCFTPHSFRDAQSGIASRWLDPVAPSGPGSMCCYVFLNSLTLHASDMDHC